MRRMRQVYVWGLWLGVQGAGVLHSRMQLPSDCECRCHEHRVEVPPHPLCLKVKYSCTALT